MTTEIILSIAHIFLGLLLITAAALNFVTNRKSSVHQAISVLFALSSLINFSLGLQMISLTPDQAIPWVAVEIFSIYAVAVSFFTFALILFLPKAGNSPTARIIGVSFIFVPLILLIFDLVEQSVTISGYNFLINVSEYSRLYTPGHIGSYAAANGPMYGILSWLRHIFYFITMGFPLVFVIWQNRKEKPQISTMALLMLVSVAAIEVVDLGLTRYITVTNTELIKTVIILVILSIISSQQAGLTLSTLRQFDFFQNIRMLHKMLLLVMGIILPSVIFMGFAIYTFVFHNILESTTGYLQSLAQSEADIVSSEFDDILHNVDHAGEDESIQNILDDTNQIYDGLSDAQIRQHLDYIEANEDYILISTSRTDEFLLFETLIQNNEMLSDLKLVDVNGGLIASTQTPDEFNLTSTDWWTEISSQGNAYIGIPQWDETLSSFTVNLAVPVYNDRDQFIGGIAVTYSLAEILTAYQDGTNQEAQFGINIANTSLIPADNLQTSIIQLPGIMSSAEIMAEDWTVAKIRNTYSLITSGSLAPEGSADLISWEISAYQDLDQALGTLYFVQTGLYVITGVILVIVILSSFFLAQGITYPLVELTDAAKEVLEGKMDVNIKVRGQDEIGTLGETFSQMTGRLSGMVTTLETTVNSRTKDLERRSLQMETSAKVARQAAEIHDLQTLLNESVNLISDQFQYYHTGIFLLDSAGRYAVLQAASSPGGQRMLARGHRLQVGKVGVVGYTAGTGLPRISQDVGADIVYYDNPDMPRTRSELALPLRVRNSIIGVLDVQSTEASAFAQEDIEILQTLADQIALAIENVRLLQSSQRALDELQRLYGQQAGQAWRQKLAGQPLAYRFTATGVEEGDPLSAISQLDKPGHKLSKEIKFRGQSIGNLNLLRESEEGTWSEDEQALIDEILEQTALALENARLVDQIRMRSDQIQLLQEVSTISSEVLDEERLIPILADKLQGSLSADHCGVVMLNGEIVTLVASASPAETKPAVGAEIHIDHDPITQRLVRTKEIDVFKDFNDDPRFEIFLNNFGLPEAKTLIVLPILVREQTVGYFYLEDSKPDREVDYEEHNLFIQLTTQISTALENIRLFDETIHRAERERQVAEITAKIRSSNDPQEILEMAVAELKKALNPLPVNEQDELQPSAPSQKENGQEGI